MKVGKKASAFLTTFAVAGALGLGNSFTAIAVGSSESNAIDIDPATVKNTSINADSRGVLVTSTAFQSFPRSGGDYLILSTGEASQVLGGTPDDFISTSLTNKTGADNQDLTQVTFELTPPSSATCLAFDFQFLSEEYPEYVGSQYNDIFTAELNENYFYKENSQVVAPNNFAYDSSGNLISINTVLGLQEVPGTAMDGSTEPLVAVSPVEPDDSGNTKLILSIQDIGDSIYDSAVLVDNFRWLYGSNCERTVAPLTDTDGDGLPDEWEINGIDYDGDGVAELDLPALGADPNRADIFIEVDWMIKPETCIWFLCWGGKDFSPNQDALQDVVAAFANAPYANPDGTSGITLHIDAGPASTKPDGNTWGAQGNGNSIPWVANLGSVSGGSYNWTDFEAIKQANLANNRRDAFHYVVYADRYGTTDSSGIARGIPSADFIVSDGPWGDGGFTRIQERGTFMHEFGHNLSLKHRWADDTTYEIDPTYLSVMNYAYQLIGLPGGSILDYSRGTPFDDWANIRFDGGSIGDLGDEAPVLESEADESLDPQTAKDLGVFGVIGDGSFNIQGPSLAFAGLKDQLVHVEVVNVGAASAEYELVIKDGTGAILGTKTVNVSAYEEQLIPLSFDATDLTVGASELEITLTSKTLGVLGSEKYSINFIDKNNAEDVAKLAEALETLSDVTDGPALATYAHLITAIGGEVPTEPTDPEPTDPEPTPTPSVSTTPEPSPTPSASVSPSASPSPSASASASAKADATTDTKLAATGAQVATWALLAAGLLGLGAATVVAVRRARKQ